MATVGVKGLKMLQRQTKKQKPSHMVCDMPLLTFENWNSHSHCRIRSKRHTGHILGHLGGGRHSQSLDWFRQTKHYRKYTN